MVILLNINAITLSVKIVFDGMVGLCKFFEFSEL